jgi:O-antigen ligase
MGVWALFVTRPALSLYALIIGTFFDALNLDVGFAKLGAGDLGALLVLGTWMGARVLRGRRIRWPQSSSLLVLYFSLALASLMLGIAPTRGYGFFIRLCTYGLCLLAVVDLLRDLKTFERLTIVLVLCSVGHAIIGFATIEGGNARMYGLIDQPNILGVQLAFGLIPLVAWMTRAQNVAYRWMLGFLFVMLLFSVVLTMSRGTYVSLTVAFLWWVRGSRRVALGVAVAGITALVLLGQFAEQRVERIEKRLEFGDDSVVNRRVVAGNALQAILHHPLLGVGFGQFEDLDKAVSVTAEKGRGAHNFYLGTAASTGLPALICLLLFAIMQAIAINRRRKVLRTRDGPDVWRVDWLLSTVQIMMIFHAVNLGMRGSQRLTEWAMLSLYAAAALLISQSETEPIEEPGPEA